MFDVIRSIIGHTLSGPMTNEEHFIYTVMAIVIPICIILAVDLICSIFRSFTRFK